MTASPPLYDVDYDNSSLKRAAARFEPISLDQMQDTALLDRVETKYVFGVSQLAEVLRQVRGAYRMLEIDGVRLNHYQTLYYDTLDFELYRQHHNRYGTRYKVRTRHYVDSQLSFFEVKRKNNRKRTLKSRYPLDAVQVGIDRRADAFVGQHTPLDGAALLPTLWNDYTRLTLVSTDRCERITVDVDLVLEAGGRQLDLPGVAIAEVKQDRFSAASPFIVQMRRHSIQRTSFSKYCVGLALLRPDRLKTNNFKPHLLRLGRIMQAERAYERAG